MGGIGNVLFEMLTGLPPFYTPGDDIKTVEKIMKRKIAWPDKSKMFVAVRLFQFVVTQPHNTILPGQGWQCA